MKQKSTSEDLAETMREVGPYLGLGTALAGTIIVFVFLGDYIDGKTGYKPIFTWAGAVLGIVLGMYNFIRTVVYLEKKKKSIK